MPTTITQKERVLQILKERGVQGLTALEALEVAGTMRLAAYVKFLRDDGYDIKAETIKVPSGKHVAKYTLVDGEKNFRDAPEVSPKPLTARKGFLFDISPDAARN